MSTGRPLSGDAATPGQLQNAKAVVTSRDTELADVRAAAAKWQAGLVGIAGSITLFSIVKSRTDIAGLSDPYPVVTGILLLLGLGLSVAGALSALRAAYGMPRLLATSNADTYADDHSRAVSARSSLRAAVWCTVLSLIAFAAALAIVWYAPQSSGPMLKVVPKAGDSACGSVVSLSDSHLVLKTKDGQQQFALGDLRTLSPVGSCP